MVHIVPLDILDIGFSGGCWMSRVICMSSFLRDNEGLECSQKKSWLIQWKEDVTLNKYLITIYSSCHRVLFFRYTCSHNFYVSVMTIVSAMLIVICCVLIVSFRRSNICCIGGKWGSGWLNFVFLCKFCAYRASLKPPARGSMSAELDCASIETCSQIVS